MGQLYVFEPWPTAVDTMGLCGPLTPTKAVCVQEKNGDFRLDIEHPIDPAGKWRSLVSGNLIKADVPLRTLPGIREGYGTTEVKRGYVANTTRDARSVWTKQFSGGIRLAVLPAGTEVHETYRDTRSWIHWPSGSGWIDTAALESLTMLSGPTALVAEMNSMVPPAKARPQLFRIYATKRTQNGVSVQARHVFYDHLGNIITVGSAIQGPGDALQKISQAATQNAPLSKASIRYLALNLAVDKPTEKWTDISPIEAIMSPSNGVLSYYPGGILRDNWTVAVVDNAGVSAGVKIEYGANMLGVDYAEDEFEVITKLVPIGQTSKGKPLRVPTGTYAVDGQSITVTDGFVPSPNASQYAVPHSAKLDNGAAIKAAGTTAEQLNAAYIKLIRAARAKFSEEQCDLPQVTLSVDFVNLGDTAEYAQYRDLQKLFLYDTVRVNHPRLGIDVTTQVNKVEWDCLLSRYNSIELGSVRKNYARTRVASWQVPGLASLGAYVDTISSLI